MKYSHDFGRAISLEIGPGARREGAWAHRDDLLGFRRGLRVPRQPEAWVYEVSRIALTVAR